MSLLDKGVLNAVNVFTFAFVKQHREIKKLDSLHLLAIALDSV